MSLFSCKHPADRLAVEKEQTTDDVDRQFVKVTYHLICQKCQASIKVVHAKTRNGVDAFLTDATPLPTYAKV